MMSLIDVSTVQGQIQTEADLFEVQGHAIVAYSGHGRLKKRVLADTLFI